MSLNPDEQAEAQPRRQHILPPSELFRLLSDRLVEYGATPEPGQPPGSYYCEVPTRYFGPAVITDEEVEDAHVAFSRPDGRKPTRESLLRSNSSVLSIRFPVMLETAPDPRASYFAARANDLRDDSRLERIYRRVLGGHDVRTGHVVFFNEYDVELAPGHIDTLKALGQSLLSLKQ